MGATKPCGPAAPGRRSGDGRPRSRDRFTWRWCAPAWATRRRAAYPPSFVGRPGPPAGTAEGATPSPQRATKGGPRWTERPSRCRPLATPSPNRRTDRGSSTLTRALCVWSSIAPTRDRPCCARCRPSRGRATCCGAARLATTAYIPASKRRTPSTGRTPGAGSERRTNRDGRCASISASHRQSIESVWCSASMRRASRGREAGGLTRSRGPPSTTRWRRARTGGGLPRSQATRFARTGRPYPCDGGS